jgi:hypothetical protein
VKPKPDKVEEPTVPYTAKKAVAQPVAKPAESGVRYADLAEVRKANAKLMQVHRKVLQKLAQ